MLDFRILTKSVNSKARVGVLKTQHGSFKTPIFIPCATRGVLRGIDWDEARQAGHSVMLVNAYHLYLLPGLKVIKKFGGLHNFCGWNGPILCDSGGYQIFSLNPKIGDSGVRFQSHIDGSARILTPEKVWEINQVLGSDIVMPLDDCPSGKANKKRTREAMGRTHHWLEKTIRFHLTRSDSQLFKTPRAPLLFGIVQGGIYRDLRKESARFISKFYEEGKIDGIAVGGVAVGEDRKKIRQVIKWMGERLPEQAPKYLMGVGEPEDIIYAVKQGYDIFDCVLPTRLGRHGITYTHTKSLKLKAKKPKIVKQNLLKSSFRYNKEKLGKTGLSKAYIHYLLKLKEMQGARMCSLHNLRVYGELMEGLKKDIKNGKL